MTNVPNDTLKLSQIAAASYQWDGKTYYRLFGLDTEGNVFRYNPSKDNEGWIQLSMRIVEPNPKDKG